MEDNKIFLLKYDIIENYTKPNKTLIFKPLSKTTMNKH